MRDVEIEEQEIREAEEEAAARRLADDAASTNNDAVSGASVEPAAEVAPLASVANTVLIPMQDILGLGSDARMNLPGRPSGNWQFRFTWEQLTPEITARLRDLTQLYDR